MGNGKHCARHVCENKLNQEYAFTIQYFEFPLSTLSTCEKFAIFTELTTTVYLP